MKKHDIHAQADAVAAEYGRSVEAARPLQDVLGTLKCSKDDLHSAYRVGSRVYGCATAISDSDYLVVRNLRGGRSDLLFRPGINITVHTVDTFQNAVNEHSMFSLECLFAPPKAVLKQGPVVPFRLNRGRLLAKVSETSETDWRKAVRLWDDELEASQKKLYHSIRVLMFARQILEHGRIVDFGEANPVWAEVRESIEWGDFTAIRMSVLADLC